MRYTSTLTMTRETVASLMLAETDHEILSTGPDDLLEVKVWADAPPTVLGHFSAAGWEPRPGLELHEPPTVNIENVLCTVCYGKIRHRKHALVSDRIAQVKPGVGLSFTSNQAEAAAEDLTDGGESQWHWVGITCISGGMYALKAVESDPLALVRKRAQKHLNLERYPVVRIVAEAMYSIKNDGGWRKSSHFDSTSSKVLIRLRAPAYPEVETFYLPAMVILQWLLEEPADEEDRFRCALRLLAEQGEVTETSVGLLCWLPVRYAKEQHRFVEEWLGKPGEKFETDAVIREVKDTRSGKVLIAQEKEGSRRLVWFPAYTSATPDVGDEIRVKGKVKRHTEWRGEKSTQLTRVRWTRQQHK